MKDSPLLHGTVLFLSPFIKFFCGKSFRVVHLVTFNQEVEDFTSTCKGMECCQERMSVLGLLREFFVIKNMQNYSINYQNGCF